MRTAPHTTRASGAVVLTLALLLPSLAAGDAAQEAESARRAGIKTLAVGSTRVHLVTHGELISLFAESAQAELILDHFKREVDGPSYTSREPLTRPVSMALHQVTLEKILRRMLEGYNYVLEYRDGRIAHVRVLRMIPGRPYKTPRVTETRSHWIEVETAAAGP